MLKDGLRLSGMVEIKIIDKKTGKVVKRIKKNAIWCEFPYQMAIVLTEGATLGAINGIKLFNGNTYVKTLSTTQSYSQDTSSKQYVVTVTAKDESTDSYTFDNLYLGYFPASGTGYTVAHQTESSAITKASDQTISITWTVYLPYDECA